MQHINFMWKSKLKLWKWFWWDFLNSICDRIAQEFFINQKIGIYYGKKLIII